MFANLPVGMLAGQRPPGRNMRSSQNQVTIRLSVTSERRGKVINPKFWNKEGPCSRVGGLESQQAETDDLT